MRIKNISIRNLYGAYSYDIHIPLDENVYIITGPNGYGKTTILNIIDNISKARWIYFYKLEFDVIIVQFDNDDILMINSTRDADVNEPDEDSAGDVEKYTVFKYMDSAGQELVDFHLSYEVLYRVTRDYINRAYVMEDEERYGRRRKTTTLERIERIVDEYPEVYQIILRKQGQEQYALLIKRLKCHFIPAERVYMKPMGGMDSSIDEVVDRIKRRIQIEYRKYLEESQKLDSQMLDLMLSTNEKVKAYGKEEYEIRAEVLRNRIEDLARYGFGDNLVIRDYNEQKAEILTVHIDFLEKKMEFISEFIEKLKAFMGCIVRKEFSHKRIILNPNEGLKFFPMNSENEIFPNSLSSGEKNEIILLYNLVFGVKKNSVLLIDEPENSLHVAWQAEFYEDIETIAKTNGIQVIVATHSPTIIGTRWNKAFDLYENNKK